MFAADSPLWIVLAVLGIVGVAAAWIGFVWHEWDETDRAQGLGHLVGSALAIVWYIAVTVAIGAVAVGVVVAIGVDQGWWKDPQWVTIAEPEANSTSTTTTTTTEEPRCAPGYKGVCLDPDARDYDCGGGTGDGPRYVWKVVRVTGSDPFDLDRDGNGWGCE